MGRFGSVFLRRLINWLAEARFFWLGLAGIAAATGFSMLIGCSFGQDQTEQARLAGVLLEVAGLLTIAAGISTLRGHFDEPSFIRQALEWLGRPPGLKSRSQTVPVSVGVGVTADVALEMEVIRSVPEDASLEERVRILQLDLTGLRDQFRTAKKSTDSKLNLLREAHETEVQERIRANNGIQDRLERITVGGVYLESVGLTWLLLGAVSAGIPDLSASFLHRVLGVVNIQPACFF